mmetsp:Transcript_20044/g.40710  ORF Transcript_20044/g.40710 Transcript_20044/m.40710 type:complete len:237 (+) Transcript_20044:81-791(+)
MALAVPRQPWSQTPEGMQQKLKYIWVCTIGIWVCALGRWVDGNVLGAANDAFSSAFGACLFQDELFAALSLARSEHCPGGASCLFPFAMLAGINCFFDALSLVAVCSPCFRSALQAQSTYCSGCFFTLGAALFQGSGSLLSWQVYRSLSVLFSYGDIETMQRVVIHAIELVDSIEDQPHIASRTGFESRGDSRRAPGEEAPLLQDVSRDRAEDAALEVRSEAPCRAKGPGAPLLAS